MYFDFEDYRPDTPTIARAISAREGVLLSIILHLLAVILDPGRTDAARSCERRRPSDSRRSRSSGVRSARRCGRTRGSCSCSRASSSPRRHRPRADLSDLDRQARTAERAPKPTNPLPFSRGNSPERIDTPAPPEPVAAAA